MANQEYRVLTRGQNELEPAINELAKDGWLVLSHTVHADGRLHTVIMERERPADQASVKVGISRKDLELA